MVAWAAGDAVGLFGNTDENGFQVEEFQRFKFSAAWIHELFQGAACLACGILAMYEIFRFDEESDLFGRASVPGRLFFTPLT